MQDMKEEFNKGIGILKKRSSWNFGNKKFNKPIKNSVENFTNKLYQVEDRVSGLENKSKELKHLGNNKNLK
jgi:hypothetical protein